MEELIKRMVEDPDIRVKTNVQVATRKWHPDPNGLEIAQDGQRGFYEPWQLQEVHNLLTSSGRDFLHQQGYYTTGLGSNGGNYIGLSADTTAPATADTTLTGEITTGGLNRQQGTVSHTNGNTTSTVVKTFTATTTHTGVRKSGLFTAVSSGTMVHENTFSSVNLENNDQLQVTWTITLS